MEQYTIYCTEEQTKRAFELGATIQQIALGACDYYNHHTKINDYYYVIPRAEQMLGWLREEKGLYIDTTWSYNNTGDEYISLIWRQYCGIMLCLENELMIEIKPEKTYKESVLKCIDRALYELERKQKPTLQ